MGEPMEKTNQLKNQFDNVVAEEIIKKANKEVKKCKGIALCNALHPFIKHSSLEILLPRGIITTFSNGVATKFSFCLPLTTLHNKHCPLGVDQFTIILAARRLAIKHKEAPMAILAMVQKYRKNGTF